MIPTTLFEREAEIATKCAVDRKRAKNYIFNRAGRTSKVFTYLTWNAPLLKAPYRNEPQPVILEQINLNWNKKQNLHSVGLRFVALIIATHKIALYRWPVYALVVSFCNANSVPLAK